MLCALKGTKPSCSLCNSTSASSRRLPSPLWPQLCSYPSRQWAEVHPILLASLKGLEPLSCGPQLFICEMEPHETPGQWGPSGLLGWFWSQPQQQRLSSHHIVWVGEVSLSTGAGHWVRLRVEVSQSCFSQCLGFYMGLPWGLSGKEWTCRCRRCGPDPWVGKIP